MAFDPTGKNLIKADDREGAAQYLEDTHPDGFFDTVGSSLLEVLNQGFAASGTSVTIGSGSKVFTLIEPRGWPAGTPVYIIDDTNPTANVMIGALSVDEAAGVITVDVTSTTGSGTFTAWTILAIFATSTVVATPVVLADGGFGADMSTLAGRTNGRENVDIPWFVPVRDFDVQDPAATDAWGDGDFGHVAASGTVGAFIGHEEAIFERTTIGVFVFIDTASLRDGDHAYEGGYGLSGVDLNRRYYNSDQSQWVQKEKPPGLTHSGPLTGGSNTISVTDESPRLLSFELKGVGAVLTLPAPGDWGSTLPRITVWSDDANVKTVNVTGGGTINGLASLTFSGVYASRTVIVDSTNGEYVLSSLDPADFAKLDEANTFTENQTVDKSAAELLLQDGASNSLSLQNTSAIEGTITKSNPSGNAILRIDVDTTDGISNATLQIMRNTITSGLCRVILNKGDGTAGFLIFFDCVTGDVNFENAESADGNPFEHFPTGTKMVFYQASPPTGWTQDTTNTQAALRVVSGTGGGTGGSIALKGSAVSGGHSVTISQMPSHTHGPGGSATTFRTVQGAGSSAESFGGGGATFGADTPTAAAGGGGAHDHDIDLKFIDVIVASKD